MLWWWWSQAPTSSQSLTDSTWLRLELCSFRIRYKTGSKLNEGGCTCSPSFLQKTFSRRWPTKKWNSMQSTSIGRLPWKSSPERRTCGITLRVKSIKRNFKIAINCWTKFKKVFLSILKPREDASLDFSSYLTKNCFRFWHRQRIPKRFRGISINASRELGSWKWTKELFLAWFQCKSSRLAFLEELMLMRARKRAMWRNGCSRLREWWLIH